MNNDLLKMTYDESKDRQSFKGKLKIGEDPNKSPTLKNKVETNHNMNAFYGLEDSQELRNKNIKESYKAFYDKSMSSDVWNRMQYDKNKDIDNQSVVSNRQTKIE